MRGDEKDPFYDPGSVEDQREQIRYHRTMFNTPEELAELAAWEAELDAADAARSIPWPATEVRHPGKGHVNADHAGKGSAEAQDNKVEGFDVIGDVHGCATKLETLLRALGYTDQGGAYRHRTRRTVFVGDLIDGGPEQARVLQIVRAMAAEGAAQVVMGNHEFNAIAYATPDPGQPGNFLRRHTKKNDGQHKEFIGEIGFGSADHIETIEWFATLPLWLDLDGLRGRRLRELEHGEQLPFVAHRR